MKKILLSTLSMGILVAVSSTSLNAQTKTTIKTNVIKKEVKNTPSKKVITPKQIAQKKVVKPNNTVIKAKKATAITPKGATQPKTKIATKTVLKEKTILQPKKK